MKRFLYEINENNSLTNDYFTISIKKNKFSIPKELAVCFSSKILSLLETDKTIREFEFNIDIHNEQLIIRMQIFEVLIFFEDLLLKMYMFCCVDTCAIITVQVQVIHKR